MKQCNKHFLVTVYKKFFVIITNSNFFSFFMSKTFRINKVHPGEITGKMMISAFEILEKFSQARKNFDDIVRTKN